MQSLGSQPTFWRNMLPTSSGLKRKPSKKPVQSRQHLKPEEGGNIFFQNTGSFSMDYMALYPRRQGIS
jgi:hypothetical protein